jgi:hypothetical protein
MIILADITLGIASEIQIAAYSTGAIAKDNRRITFFGGSVVQHSVTHMRNTISTHTGCVPAEPRLTERLIL